MTQIKKKETSNIFGATTKGFLRPMFALIAIKQKHEQNYLSMTYEML